MTKTKYRVVLANGMQEFNDTPEDLKSAQQFAAANKTTVQTITYDDAPPPQDLEVPAYCLRIVLKGQTVTFTDPATNKPVTTDMLTRIDSLIAAIPDATQQYAAKTAWDYAATIHSLSPTVAYLQQGLNLTVEQVQQIFAAAAQINV